LSCLAAAFAGTCPGKPSSLMNRARASIGGPHQGRKYLHRN
jgi:hypothetical protein